MGRSPHFPLIAIALLAGVSAAAAQERRSVIKGSVVAASTLEPIANAQVALVGAGRTVRTDKQGMFVFDSLVAGTYLVQVRGVDDETPMTEVPLGRRETVELEVKLGKTSALMLPELTTSAPGAPDARFETNATRLPPEFLARKQTGVGHFITRDEIQRRSPPRLTDIFRSVQGMTVTCRGVTCVPRSIRAPRACTPIVVVDRMSTDVGVLNGMMANDIEAVEIYHGASTVPVEYLKSTDRPQCGMIVIWTRVPPQRRPGA